MKKGVLLVAVIIILAVFTACQPTPEIEQVVNKGSSVMDESLKEDNISPQSPNIPEEYFYEYTSSNGNIKVTTDAEIVFTDNDALPVYSCLLYTSTGYVINTETTGSTPGFIYKQGTSTPATMQVMIQYKQGTNTYFDACLLYTSQLYWGWEDRRFQLQQRPGGAAQPLG